MEPFTVSIDGPVAAGKSTIGRKLAERIEALFFDTGILYRAVAHTALECRLDPDATEDIAEIARGMRAELREVSGETRLIVGDRDITDELRTPEIDRILPAISANPGVRSSLLQQQRDIVHGRRSVVVGRDVGTVVLPGADLKIYLDAEPNIRATRRYEELRARGIDIDLKTVHRDLVARDERDSARELAPLLVADDAIVVDATDLGIGEVVERIAELVAERGGACGK